MPPHPPPRRPPRARAGGIVDLTKEEPDHDDAVSILREAPTSLPMPGLLHQPPRHPSATATGTLSSTSSSLRKRRASLFHEEQRPAKSSRTPGQPEADDPFKGDDEELEQLFSGSPGDDGLAIDLSDATEVPQATLIPKPDNRIQLGKFQCVICMDDVTALTVTHCGHLFCSECLHSALHIDSNKKVCPVCRTKVDLKNTKSKTSKGYFHLELKLMTTRKQGKRPAG